MADNNGCNVSVTVNNGSTPSSNRQIRTGRQLVTITPLPPGYHPPNVPRGHQPTPCAQPSLAGPTAGLNLGHATAHMAQVLSRSHHVVPERQREQVVESKLDKVLLKAAYKGKKEFKTFTLRNVDTAAIASSKDLKKLIKDRLRDDISSKDFDIGYMQGSNVIRVRTKEDLSEMWLEVKKQGTLWCDGLLDTGSQATKASRKGRRVSDEDSDDEPAQYVSQRKKKKDNEAKVQEIVDSLKSKYGSQFTIMQIRIWAELIASGLYPSTSEPPHENSMFQKAGGSSASQKKKDQSGSAIAQALSEAATAITCALTQSSSAAKGTPAHGASTSSSPAKMIDSRAKLYKQLSELQNLKSMGILTDAEYAMEKETIMDLLKKLKSH